ncbi:hypothetical protein [Streptomyces mirabilis]|uniref:hypothetical protein n=1 Tax=Streptomyces mirabilis TaxID=68239 RepID=UPI0033B45AE6
MLGVTTRRGTGAAAIRLPLSEAVWIRSVRLDPVAVGLASTGCEVDVRLQDCAVGPAPAWADEDGVGVRLSLGYRQGRTALCRAEVWLPGARAVPKADKDGVHWPLSRWEQPRLVVDDLSTRTPDRAECAELSLDPALPVLQWLRTGVTLTGRITDQVRLVLPGDRITLGHGTLRRR